MLLFDALLFVHAGIPRDATHAPRSGTDLSSPQRSRTSASRCCGAIRATADYIPDELQAQNARFPFGRLQFERSWRSSAAR